MKKFNKGIISLTLAVVVFLTAIQVQATTYTTAMEPIYVAVTEDATEDFYANGNKITIKAKESGEGALIVWQGLDGQEKSQEVTEKVVIYGGGQVNTHFATSNITLEGGTVWDILGGGKGSKTETANVDEVTITVTGGNLTNLLLGGGRLSSVVKKSTITMTGGTVDYLHGGGHASYKNKTVGVVTELEKSPCRVEEVVINISGGKIYLESDGYGSLFGGGQGNSYTGKSTINISGNVDLEKAFVQLSGSNGMTENATLNISKDFKGVIKQIQSVNRGSMKYGTFNIEGGETLAFYVGQATSQNSSTDNLPAAFITGGKITANILGGKINVIHPGYNYRTLFSANTEILDVYYKDGTIVDTSTLATEFGTSIKKIPVVTTEQPVIADEELNTFVGVDYDFAVEVDKYTWNFNLKDETEVPEEINLAIEEITITEELEELKEVKESTETLVLKFSHQGALPKNTAITYKTEFEKGTLLKLYYLNETTQQLELVNGEIIVDEDGNITFGLEHCSTYVLTAVASVEPDVANPSTSDNVLVPVILGLISASALCVTLVIMKKRKSN